MLHHHRPNWRSSRSRRLYFHNYRRSPRRTGSMAGYLHQRNRSGSSSCAYSLRRLDGPLEAIDRLKHDGAGQLACGISPQRHQHPARESAWRLWRNSTDLALLLEDHPTCMHGIVGQFAWRGGECPNGAPRRHHIHSALRTFHPYPNAVADRHDQVSSARNINDADSTSIRRLGRR